MHGKVNERIERITKSTCFYVCEVYCALVVTSALIQTLINYYIVGLGDDAFYLPILAVYVCTQYATSIEETYLFVLLICIFFQISIQLENTFGLFGRLDHLHFGRSLHTDFILIVFMLLRWVLLANHFLCERHNKWVGCVNTGHRWPTKWPKNQRNFQRNRRSLFECETVKWKKLWKTIDNARILLSFVFPYFQNGRQIQSSISSASTRFCLMVRLDHLYWTFVGSIGISWVDFPICRSPNFCIKLFFFSFLQPLRTSHTNNRRKERILRILSTHLLWFCPCWEFFWSYRSLVKCWIVNLKNLMRDCTNVPGTSFLLNRNEFSEHSWCILKIRWTSKASAIPNVHDKLSEV